MNLQIERHKQRLQGVRKAALGVGLVTVVAMVVALFVFRHFAAGIERNAQDDLRAIALSKQAQLSSFIQERIRDAEVLVQRPAVWGALAARGGDTKVPSGQPLQLTLEQTARAYGYRQILLFDSKLQIVGPVTLDPLQSMEFDALRETMAKGSAKVVNVHNMNGGPSFGLAAPVFERGDVARRVIGAVYIEIDAQRSLYPIVSHWPASSFTAESYLVRRDGQEVVYLTPLRYAPQSVPLGMRRQLDAPDYIGKAEFASSAATLVRGNDYRGVEVLGASVPIAGTDWVLVAKKDYVEVTDPIHKMALGIVGVTVFIVAAMLAMLALMWRGQRQKYEARETLQDTRYKAASDASMDGYMVANTVGNIEEVNDAVAQYTGYSSEELCAMRVMDLDALRTPENIQKEMQSVTSAGRGRYQSQWRRKDGTLMDVALSVTYIPRSEGGEFHAFIRDISQEIAARRRIERLNTFYLYLSQANAAIFNGSSRQEILNAVCEGAVRYGQFVTVWAGIPDAAVGRIVPVSVAGAGVDYVNALVITTEPDLPTSQGPTVRCMHEQTIQFSDDFQSDKRMGPWQTLAAKNGICSSAAVPVVLAGKTVVVLSFYAREKAYFDAEIRGLLEEVARNVALALQALDSDSARRSAEVARKMSEEHFRSVFDVSPLPMHIVSLATRASIVINLAHERTFGYALAEIANEDAWFERVYPDATQRNALRELWNADVQKAQQSGPSTAVTSPEITLRCKDGSDRVVRGFMVVVGDDIVVQWEDLTEIRRHQEQLLGDERRYRGMIEQTITGIYVMQDDKIVYVNPRLCDVLGLTQEQVLGRDFADVMGGPASTRHSMLEVRQRLWRGERSVALTLPFHRSDGKLIDIGLHATQGIWNGLPAIVVMAQDITERKHAEEKIAAYVKQLEGTMRGTLHAVAKMVDLRDPYTAGHERRVGVLAADIAREMGWAEERCQSLELIGLVHDIGKIAIPAEILSKPTRLTPLEYEMVKGHAERGYEILKDVDFPMPIAEIIREHHERMDGTGYPHGLKGQEILPEARVLAVADVLESMASHRPYRPSLGLDIALHEIESHRGTWFDAPVVDAMLRLVREKGYQLPG